jgi:hypothetical protein
MQQMYIFIYIYINLVVSQLNVFFRYFLLNRILTNMPLARDLLHPSIEEERRKHKKKRLVQSPNSYFMDVKCPGCYKITTGKINRTFHLKLKLCFFSFLFFSF